MCLMSGVRHRQLRGFTLVEIVVSLTIITIVLAVAIPTVKGLTRDEAARAPIKTLAEIVQEARHRAMREGLPYQIVFEREGIHASPATYPYEKRDEFLAELETMRTPPPEESIERVVVEQAGVQREEMVNGRPVETAPVAQQQAPAWEMPWTVSIPLELGTECEVLMWGDGGWDLIEGEKMRRWVFQPSGIANPARVRLRSGGLQLEAGFDVLTGEMTSESARAATANL